VHQTKNVYNVIKYKIKTTCQHHCN